MTVPITSHGLSVRPAGVRTTTTPLPSFASNEQYVVTVTGTGGASQVLSFRDSYTPAAGKAAVRLINVSGSTNGVDIYVTDPGAVLGTASASNVLTGTASTYFDVTVTRSRWVDFHRVVARGVRCGQRDDPRRWKSDRRPGPAGCRRNGRACVRVPDRERRQLLTVSHGRRPCATSSGALR